MLTLCNLAACSYKSNKLSENLPLCIMQFLDNYDYLKGANEVNRRYFQHTVLLCLLKALYFARICSYAACIILCPKLCWHNSPRPTQNPPPALLPDQNVNRTPQLMVSLSSDFVDWIGTVTGKKNDCDTVWWWAACLPPPCRSVWLTTSLSFPSSLMP